MYKPGDILLIFLSDNKETAPFLAVSYKDTTLRGYFLTNVVPEFTYTSTLEQIIKTKTGKIQTGLKFILDNKICPKNTLLYDFYPVNEHEIAGYMELKKRKQLLNQYEYV